MKKENGKWLVRGFAFFIILCVIGGSVSTVSANVANVNRAVSKMETQDNADYSKPVEFNEENIKKFVDNYFTKNMEKYHAPGVAVAVVKDNKELYKAGYGVSDMESGKLVNPDTTTFPAASVSKLFTATAIMQLYQAGKIDINESIEKYVKDITIQNPFDQAITCSNLLTHSSGLDEQSELDGCTLNKEFIEPQKNFFDVHIPQVIVKPGTVCRYSNMGYNLLGYIVEKVSGKSYEDYVTNHILEPLEMQNASVRIDDSNMACGYCFDNGRYVKQAFAYQHTSGSSGIIATVTDMEKFMMMHLNDGTYNNKTILNPSVVQMMQKKQFSNNNIFDGMGYGFIRTSRNGVHLVKHEGALLGYTTTLILIPEQKIGIYVASNSLSGMVFDFEEAFLDYFYGTCKEVSVGCNVDFDYNKYIGTYRSYDGISERKITKIFAALDKTAELTISKVSDNRIKVSYYTQSKTREETELFYKSKGIFVRQDGKGYITFRENKNGEIEYAFHDVSHQAYKKIGRLESGTVIGMTILITLLLFISSIIILCIKAIRGRLGINKKVWALIGLNNMLLVIGSVGVFVLESVMILNSNYSNMYVLKILLTLIMIAAILILCSIIYGCYCVIKKKLGKREGIAVVVIVLTQVLFIIILNYLNMIGYNLY